MALAPGTRLGPYEVTAQIGQGGMGQVYRARDTKLDRDVAIKFLPDAFAHDADRLARFQREAKTLASLNHPNIAGIYGLEESEGMTALVMELVEGDDLSQRIRRGAIPIDEALPMARQIAEALEAAHEQGIIHRDLKPANIKVRPDGTVKVLDFGLAKAIEPRGVMSPGLSQSPTVSTQAGMILGTAAYMAPEQAKGRTVDRRADVWAFGCVLYEMLTGHRAFAGDDASDTLAAVLRAEVDWTLLPATVPPSLRAFLTRCLKKDPKQRVHDIADVRLALEGAFETVATGTSVPAVAPRPIASAWRRAVPSLVSALAAGAIVGVAWWVWWAWSPDAPSMAVTRFSVPLAEDQNFTNTGRQAVAISPDGSQIMYVANSTLYIRPMATAEARAVPGARGQGGLLNPIFSPDGGWIAFWSAADNAIKRIAVSGGAAVTVCPAERPLGMSWDGDEILFGQIMGIMRVSPATGGAPELIVNAGAGEVLDTPQMLPDGRTVLFTVTTSVGTDRWDKANVIAQALGSSERTVLVKGGSAGRYVPSGHIVYAVGGTLFGAAFDLSRLAVMGGSVPIIAGIRRAEDPEIQTGAAHFSVSSSGSLVHLPGPTSTTAPLRQLVRLGAKGETQPLKIPPGSYQSPRISPDGTRLAYDTDDGKEADIFVYDLSGASTARRLTFGGRNRSPVWSSDGERLAFQSDRDGDLAIFWQRADGAGQAERLTTADEKADVSVNRNDIPEAWMPKGGQLLFSRPEAAKAEDGNVSLWMLSTADKKAKSLGVRFSMGTTLGAGGMRLSVSPNGRWLAYDSRGISERGIYVLPFPPTGGKHEVARRGNFPVWSRDGQQLFYLDASEAGSWVLTARSVATASAFTLGNPVALPTPQLPRLTFEGRPFDVGPGGFIISLAAVAESSAEGRGPRRIEVVLNWFEELKRLVPAY